jgi:branched-chain amino acid transport system permease protein
MIDMAGSATLTRYRFQWPEVLPLAAALAAFFLFPDYLVFGAAVLAMAIFAISLDLIIGFAGILTLGHGVFYGVGAYAAGLITFVGWHEPISSALLGAAIAATFAAATGPFVLRLKGLPLVMVTLSIGFIVLEAANKASWLTGGHNGLQNIEIAPILGRFEWSIYGDVSYLYVLAFLVVVVLAARIVVSSPFGVALQGIRENEARMRVIGAPVLAQLVLAYAISAFVAGLAGALSTQTNAFVSLDVLSLDLSIYALAMLVLGGIGRLYGALIGAVVYMGVQYFTQQWNPSYWMFSIGILLILVVRFGRGGLLGLSAACLKRLSSRAAP